MAEDRRGDASICWARSSSLVSRPTTRPPIVLEQPAVYRGWRDCLRSPRSSGPGRRGSRRRRGGCPPRLPQNRTYAVRIRLFGTAGYNPRRRPVDRPRIIPTAPVVAIRGRRSARSLDGVSRRGTPGHASRSTRCAAGCRRLATEDHAERFFTAGRTSAKITSVCQHARVLAAGGI